MKLSVIEAHKYSRNNRNLLLKSNICGCFYCLNIFFPFYISEWISIKTNEDTVLCPYCEIDSVLPENSCYPITTEFLKEMNKYWFNEK